MDEAQMADLLAPIGHLGASMTALEVSDEEAQRAMDDVLAGGNGGGDDADGRARAGALRAKSEARDLVREALRHAQLAAQLESGDSAARRKALLYFEKALEEYAAALQGGGVPDASAPRLVELMGSYLDKARTIREHLADPNLDDGADGERRRRVLTVLAQRGCSVLARAVAARKAALLVDGDDASPRQLDWRRFVLYSDAADCFITYLKLFAGRPPDAVTQATTDVLSQLEAVAPMLQRLPPPPPPP
ncbi:hypothetical protein M885DRAFT_513325 [Pelagophyceae sp. CCMP2097]|nr:hypothetical protein M885DRAFT_513325 [Pelagophyceae sp. CCMP2097]